MNLPFIPPGWNQTLVLVIAGAVILGLIGAWASSGGGDRVARRAGFTAPVWVMIIFLMLVAGLGLWFVVNTVRMVGLDF